MIRNIVILFLVALTQATCINFKEVKCTGIKGFKINKVNTESIDAEVMLQVNNPNTFGFKLLPSEFNVSYSGIKLGQAKLVKKTKIRANTEATYSFRLSGDFKSMTLTDVMKMLESFTRKGTLEVNGQLRVGKLFTKKTFPVSYKEKISVDN